MQAGVSEGNSSFEQDINRNDKRTSNEMMLMCGVMAIKRITLQKRFA